jgi:hypothetical protein
MSVFRCYERRSSHRAKRSSVSFEENLKRDQRHPKGAHESSQEEEEREQEQAEESEQVNETGRVRERRSRRGTRY